MYLIATVLIAVASAVIDLDEVSKIEADGEKSNQKNYARLIVTLYFILCITAFGSILISGYRLC